MQNKLIVGLGNFPEEYKNTRHNIGFNVIDKLCEKFDCELNHEMFKGLFTNIKINNANVYLAKPLTYMNRSGDFVSQIMNYLKIDANDILIICDDINLDIGKIRLRKSGSSGGQNGLKDIINKIHSENFVRLRVGISKPTNKNIDLADYVLSKFTNEEKNVLNSSIEKATNLISDYLQTRDIDQIMNKYNN